jgi:hypothetical protein
MLKCGYCTLIHHPPHVSLACSKCHETKLRCHVCVTVWGDALEHRLVCVDCNAAGKHWCRVVYQPHSVVCKRCDTLHFATNYPIEWPYDVPNTYSSCQACGYKGDA